MTSLHLQCRAFACSVFASVPPGFRLASDDVESAQTPAGIGRNLTLGSIRSPMVGAKA